MLKAEDVNRCAATCGLLTYGERLLHHSVGLVSYTMAHTEVKPWRCVVVTDAVGEASNPLIPTGAISPLQKKPPVGTSETDFEKVPKSTLLSEYMLLPRPLQEN